MYDVFYMIPDETVCYYDTLLIDIELQHLLWAVKLQRCLSFLDDKIPCHGLFLRVHIRSGW